METYGAHVAWPDDGDSAACGAPWEILCKLFNKLIFIQLHIISWTTQYILYPCQG